LFGGEFYIERMRIAAAAIVPPLPDVPRELETVIRKALAKDIVERYRNPGELAHALVRLLVN